MHTETTVIMVYISPDSEAQSITHTIRDYETIGNKNSWPKERMINYLEETSNTPSIHQIQ